jgi:hypothetical protein
VQERCSEEIRSQCTIFEPLCGGFLYTPYNSSVKEAVVGFFFPPHLACKGQSPEELSNLPRVTQEVVEKDSEQEWMFPATTNTHIPHKGFLRKRLSWQGSRAQAAGWCESPSNIYRVFLTA